MLFHNSWLINYRKPFGAIATGENVEICVNLPIDFDVKRVDIAVCKVDEWNNETLYEMKYKDKTQYEKTYSINLSFNSSNTMFYYFKIDTGYSRYVIKKGEENNGIMSKDIPNERYGIHWQLTVCSNKLRTPKALKGIMYQIFPDRFCFSGTPKEGVAKEKKLRNDWYGLPVYRPNENGEIANDDFFQGDLKGIQSKRDYLKSLGVTVVYLNPIFEAYSNHGYDTGDYEKIDPIKGTNEDFEELAKSFKEKGISIILDGVFSHTGADSKYFNKFRRYPNLGAYQGRDSIYYDWYMFTKFPDDYKGWWDYLTLPTVNKDNDNYIYYITKNVIRYWLSHGATGFRYDVADELNDKFLFAAHAATDEFGNVPIIGEIWEDASLKESYGERRRYLLEQKMDNLDKYSWGKDLKSNTIPSQVNSVMNYPFAEAILNYVRYGDYKTLNNIIMTILENYPKPIVSGLMNLLGTHDSERAMTKLAGIELKNPNDREWQAAHHKLSPELYTLGVSRLMIASIIQFFLPGVPCIYYGDEAGLTGYKDPFNRCCYPWEREDKNLIKHYQTIGKIRIRNLDILSKVEYRVIALDNDKFVFERKYKDRRMVIAVNRTDKTVYVPVEKDMENAKTLYIVGNSTKHRLSPFGAIIYRA